MGHSRQTWTRQYCIAPWNCPSFHAKPDAMQVCPRLSKTVERWWQKGNSHLGVFSYCTGKEWKGRKGEQSQGTLPAKVKFGHLNQNQQSPEAPLHFLLTPEKLGDSFIFDTKKNRSRTRVLLAPSKYSLSFLLLKECKGRKAKTSVKQTWGWTISSKLCTGNCENRMEMIALGLPVLLMVFWMYLY